MTTHLGLQRILLPSAQVSSLTTGSITLPSARGTFTPPSDYEFISSFTSTGAESTVTLGSIPQTYSAIELRMSVRSTRSGNTTDGGAVRFNNDTGSNYHYSIQDHNGGAFTAVNGAGQTSDYLFYYYPGGTATSNVFAVSNYSIYGYTQSTGQTIISSRGYADNGVTHRHGFQGALWSGNAAITSITIFSLTSSNFTNGSKFSLYGLKGA
jgi:hypothetical protein